MDDAAQIKQNVANFAFRDQARWDELRDLFHPDGTIAVTWYTGPIAGFIEGSKKMTASGRAQTKHWVGASRTEIAGDRALCDTDVVIMARSKLAGVEVDITAFARFFDRFERRADRIWRVARRIAVYEKDRLDPVAPSFRFPILYRLAGFSRYPASYKHLAAGLVRAGQKINTDIVEAGAPAEQELWRAARAWLAPTEERQAAQ
jgi:SnoaL-like domain